MQEKLTEKGIFDNSYIYSLFNYNSIKNSMNKREKFSKFAPGILRHKKNDEQYAIKLNLTGKYQLFDRTHDFYMSYGFNNETIESDYVEIFQTPYRPKPKSEAGNVHASLAGICEPDPNGREISPFTRNIPEPNWGFYDAKGNHKVYIPACKDSSNNIQLANYNYSKYLNRNRTHSAVVSTRFNATDKWHLLGGVQFTHFSTSQSKEMNVLDGRPASAFQNQASLAFDREHYTARAKGHKFTPYFGITYDLTDNQSLYASYTKVFKQQDNVDVTNKTALPPLLGTNYEIGWKGSFFENRLNSSLAFFNIEQKNRTVVDFTYVPGDLGSVGSFQTVAKPIGRVVSKGFELEIAGNVTEDWQLFLGYTYNKSKYKNAKEINAERLAKNSKADPYNFSNFTPVQMFRLATSYHIPNTKWTIGGGVSAQSPTSSLYGIDQAGYALWDANIQYAFNSHAKLSLIGVNLTDKTYFENNYNRTRGMNNFYGRPRTVMMKFDWEF